MSIISDPTLPTATAERPAKSARATSDAPDPAAEAIQKWLPDHCRSLPGVTRGIAVAADANSLPRRVIASWPEGFAGPTEMVEMADAALTGRRKSTRITTPTGWVDRFAMPIARQGKLLAALVVEADNLNAEQRNALITRLIGRAPSHAKDAGGQRRTPSSKAAQGTSTGSIPEKPSPVEPALKKTVEQKPATRPLSPKTEVAKTIVSSQPAKTVVPQATTDVSPRKIQEKNAARPAVDRSPSDPASDATRRPAPAVADSHAGPASSESTPAQGLARAPAKTPASNAAADPPVLVLDLLATCLDTARAQAASMAFVTELASRTGCDRVSFGRPNRHGQVRVGAISNSARIAERSNIVRAIEAAMQEAIDQGQTIVYPQPDGKTSADRDHDELSRMQGRAHVMTVPLAHDGEITGAITLEQHGEGSFGSGLRALCETLAAVVGPVLELKHRDEQSHTVRIAHSIREQIKTLIGPSKPALKVGAMLVAGLFAWLTLATGTHRVAAPAQLEGRIHRAIVAPIDGFVASAEVRAGDEVREGDVLSRLDDSDLKVELSKWRSEADQLRKQYRGALATHDRAESAILNARIARATAQLELIDRQLARTELRAPFDGVVVAGDLSQLLGSPVERGDVLFEVAPLNDYRVVLEVDERDVTRIVPGLQGRLALEGLPSDALPIVVEKITPVATPRDGRNFFRVEALVQSDADLLRPGMAGVAKIDAGERRLLWIWTHRLTDWLRLRLWVWLP